ncbi:MAG: hypothetical protein DRP80_04775 [Candidatus Omnitrophota bacterium]|nr:MAG: hypothetical protein DRP80_04775 [Candidatus Omnitrophota bacterium]
MPRNLHIIQFLQERILAKKKNKPLISKPQLKNQMLTILIAIAINFVIFFLSKIHNKSSA